MEVSVGIGNQNSTPPEARAGYLSTRLWWKSVHIIGSSFQLTPCAHSGLVRQINMGGFSCNGNVARLLLIPI